MGAEGGGWPRALLAAQVKEPAREPAPARIGRPGREPTRSRTALESPAAGLGLEGDKGASSGTKPAADSRQRPCERCSLGTLGTGMVRRIHPIRG